jgi:tetratricopeptide (TPR) repeat protein
MHWYSQIIVGLLMGLAVMPAARAFESDLTKRGIAEFREGRYSTAVATLRRALADQPADSTTQIFLALAQSARNDCAAALPALTKHLEIADSALARLDGLAAAKCQESLGNSAAELATLEKLQRRFPNDADVIYTIARFHMKAFNDETLVMYQRAPASYRVHQLSAEIFEIQGQYDSAVDEFRKAIELNPKAPDLHYRLGRAILMRSHDAQALVQARAEFEAERKLNPEDAATEFQLGQIAQVENKPDEAEGHFQSSLKLAPDFPEALVALGRLQAQSKRYPEAIATLRRVVDQQPSNEAAHYALMMAYRDSGQAKEAKAEKATLDRLQRSPDGEFSDFLKKLGGSPPKQ